MTGLIKYYAHMLKMANKYRGHISDQIFYRLKEGKIKSAYNYIWTILFTKEEGAGLADKLFLINPDLAPYPGRIELEVTTKCSLRCEKCEHTYWNEQEEDLSYEKFKHVIGQFPKLKAISLSGIGHGFHNPEYMKMLRYVKSKSIFTQFFDPFLLINEQRAREIVKIGIDKIWMSLDAATEDTYKKVQAGSDFDTVIRNAKKLIEIKKELRSPYPELAFHFIITEKNVHEMPMYIDLVEEITQGTQKLNIVQFTKLIPFKENMHLMPEIPKKIINDTRRKARKYKHFRVDFFNVQGKPPICECTAWTVPFITVDGSIYPCCTLTEGNLRPFFTNVFGNVFQTDFKKVWESKEFKKFIWAMHFGKVPHLCYYPRPCTIFSIEGEKLENVGRVGAIK